MQEAIPYRTYIAAASDHSAARDRRGGSDDGGELLGNGELNGVAKSVAENAVVVFGRRGCCMCHVVKRLLLGHGVNPAVFEVDQEDEAAVIDELARINGENLGGDQEIKFPAVFVGGKLFGGLEKVMATHISGELVPILKDAGALWL